MLYEILYPNQLPSDKDKAVASPDQEEVKEEEGQDAKDDDKGSDDGEKQESDKDDDDDESKKDSDDEGTDSEKNDDADNKTKVSDEQIISNAKLLYNNEMSSTYLDSYVSMLYLLANVALI